MGYHRAGFDVVGVDIVLQPRYPFDFIQADAMTWPLNDYDYDVIHASPPCQAYSISTPKAHRGNHPDLIAETRTRLAATRLPFVIENVRGARNHLRDPLMLCGRMFGLGLERHRYFEINPMVFSLLPACDHSEYPVLITGTHRRANTPRFEYNVAQCREASGIPWMTRKELDQAIPPAYTEHIGRLLLKDMDNRWYLKNYGGAA